MADAEADMLRLFFAMVFDGDRGAGLDPNG